MIVDMDQPGVRKFVPFYDENGGEMEVTQFESLDEIRELKQRHNLGVFSWVVVDMEFIDLHHLD